MSSGCDSHLDAILNAAEVTGETRDHLSDCAECAGLYDVVAALREQGELVGVRPSAKLRAVVLAEGRAWMKKLAESPEAASEKIKTEEKPAEPIQADSETLDTTSGEAASPPTKPSSSWWADLVPWTLAGAMALVLLFCVQTGMLISPDHPDLKGSNADPINLAKGPVSPGGPVSSTDVVVPRNQDFSVALADGSTLSGKGPAHFLKLPRGFHLFQGSLRVQVRPDPRLPFQGTTPHAVVTVLGTVFTVSVQGKTTDIVVHEGKVRVTGQPTGPKVLTIGEKLSVHETAPPGKDKPLATTSYAADPDSEDPPPASPSSGR